jgi:hypothetical protein
MMAKIYDSGILDPATRDRMLELGKRAADLAASNPAIQDFNRSQSARARDIAGVVEQSDSFRASAERMQKSLDRFMWSESAERLMTLQAIDLPAFGIPIAADVVEHARAAIDGVALTKVPTKRAISDLLSDGVVRRLLDGFDRPVGLSATDVRSVLGIDDERLDDLIESLERIAAGDDDALVLGAEDWADDDYAEEFAWTLAEKFGPLVDRDYLSDFIYVVTFLSVLSAWAAFVVAVPGAQPVLNIAGSVGLIEIHMVAKRAREMSASGDFGDRFDGKPDDPHRAV